MMAEIIPFPLCGTLGVHLRRVSAEAREFNRECLQVAALAANRDKPIAEITKAITELARSLPWRPKTTLAYVRDRCMAGMDFEQAVKPPKFVGGVAWVPPEWVKA